MDFMFGKMLVFPRKERKGRPGTRMSKLDNYTGEDNNKRTGIDVDKPDIVLGLGFDPNILASVPFSFVRFTRSSRGP
jgi:hypothetical protein